MDWVLALPDGLEQQFNDFVTQYEEDKKMPYVTSIERSGLKKGALQNARDYVVKILKVRFKQVPQALTEQIQAIEDEELLSKLHEEAVLIDSIKSFKQFLENNLD